ncbi:MAG TPA: hypothetical protein VG125_12055 [Pirellulales bacterium]|jgi:hypothetical protein|nr:hypothetical protein [Pirellulales bacterium]
MDTPAESVFARLASYRAALRESVQNLDQAIAECQKAKREALETLAELDLALGATPVDLRCRGRRAF